MKNFPILDLKWRVGLKIPKDSIFFLVESVLEKKITAITKSVLEKNNWANMKMSNSCYRNNKNVMETNFLYLWCSQWPFLIIRLRYQRMFSYQYSINHLKRKEILHLFSFIPFIYFYMYAVNNHSYEHLKINFCNSNSK